MIGYSSAASPIPVMRRQIILDFLSERDGAVTMRRSPSVSKKFLGVEMLLASDW